VGTWEQLAGLALHIEGYALEGRELAFSDAFVRHTTLITLRGGGEEGVGEDVVYEAEDHKNLQAAGPILPLAGSWTLGSFSGRLEELDLFPDPPRYEVSPLRDVFRRYRRWAFESAALDLALRQSGQALGGRLGRELRPLTYVVSMRLAPPGNESPETSARMLGVLAKYPGTRFKLDPTNTWSAPLIDELAASGVVASLDLKGQYENTPVDVRTDPELYRRLCEAFPDAWLEDPDLNDETRAILEPHRDRITWDAPIHSVEDILARAWEPRMVNIKPSRFGTLAELCRAYDFCAERGIGAYGGGQTELGVGRDHIQLLAALFHPDTPNDVAPRGFNLPQVPGGMEASPLELRAAATGFRFAPSGA
jgi:L-alanine-DL-glutamate epimerase-like enolase superfamily enzyme